MKIPRLIGRLILIAKAMQAISSTFLVILPVGRTPMAPKDKIIMAGIAKLPKLKTLRLKAVSVTAA